MRCIPTTAQLHNPFDPTQKKHVAKLIATSNGKQTKQLWQALKNTTHPNTIPESLPSNTTQNPSTNLEIASAFNLHFTNITNKYQSNKPPPYTNPHTSSDTCNKVTAALSKIPHLILYLKSIDTKKATGADGLSVKILHIAMPYIISPLTDILNHAITNRVFPTQ